MTVPENQVYIQEGQVQAPNLASMASELQQKDTQIRMLQQENEILQAKYYAELKSAAETKKKNLAAYYSKRRNPKSKSIEDQVAEIVGTAPKSLPIRATTEIKQDR